MNRLRLSVSVVGIAILLAGTVRLAAGWFPLMGEPEVLQADVAAMANSASQRAPVRAGSNVMESKLIHKVDPVYPQLAKDIRLSGRVILVITVNEEGFVSDAQVKAGHPLLTEAAVEAVKQWQYSPTLLNGQAVPVKATVEVVFVLKGDKAETGSGSNAPALPPPPTLYTGSSWFSAGPNSIVFFSAMPVDEKDTPSSNIGDFRSPQFDLTPDEVSQWKRMADQGWPAGVAKGTPLEYSFTVNEVGQISNFARIQGPEIPDLERELSRLPVESPGFCGSDLVSAYCTIEITVGLSPDEIQGLIESNMPPPQ